MENEITPQSSPPPSPQLPKTYRLTASSISYTKATAATAAAFNPCGGGGGGCGSSPTDILREVSVTAYPSQVLAIVGPSGAGKSTLLDILAARTSPTSGSLLINSTPLRRGSYRKLSAYVPQHDACLPQLTVSETFAFAASLLRPSSGAGVTVEALLDELRLVHVAHTRMKSGLSGGERRRVSIGLSLLRDPAVLLLDEPTSGLDSASAFHVVQILQSVAAARGRTVVLSIHQPSYKILSAIDQLLLLSKGSVVYHGTLHSFHAFLEARGFRVPPQLNSLEYAMEILVQLSDRTTTTPESAGTCNVSTVSVSAGESDDVSVSSSKDVIEYRSSRGHEIWALSGRYWKIIYRTKQLLVINTLEALVVGLVLGTMYINIGYDKQGMEKRFGLFAFTLTFLLTSTTDTLVIFVGERPIVLWEVSGGLYRLSSYLVANTLVFLPYLLLIAVIYSVSVYFLVGLCATWQAFGYFVLVIWAIVLMANSLVLCLSALAPNYIAGTSLVAALLAAFFLFSGYFISKESLPKYWLGMHYMSMYKYALDALLLNEYACLENICMLWYRENETCMVTGGDVLRNRGLKEEQRWINVYVLFGFFILYRVLCFLVLSKRVSRSKK